MSTKLSSKLPVDQAGSRAISVRTTQTNTPARRKLARLRNPTLYERLTYRLDILIPEDEPEDMEVPRGHVLQQVHYGKVHKWRVHKNPMMGLPEYLAEVKEVDEPYTVFKEKEGMFPLFDSTSVFLKRWDLLSLVLLLFTASVTPFETAFVTGPTQIDVLFLINRAVDLVFLFDMFVQMRSPFRDAQTGKLIRKGRAIAIRYLKSWFLIDLVSIIPFELINIGQEESASKTNLSQLRLLRFMRLTRLLKLLRVLRASRKIKQWQVHINMRYATLQIMKLCFIIIFVIHWIACAYRLAAEANSPTEAPGWLTNYAHWKLGTNATSNDIDRWEAYVLALYWSSATISLVGPSWSVISPTAVRELGFAFFANFLAYIITLYFIATLVNVVGVAFKVEREHELRVDNYLEMFYRLKLDDRLKVQVHGYLTDHFAVATTEAYTNLLKELPPQLHGFISLEIFVSFIERIPYLEPFIGREPMMIQELCRGIEIRSFPPNGILFMEGYEGIYLLEHGILAIEGRVYPSGSVFGRTVLRENIKQSEARALTNCTVHMLPKAVLVAAMERHPKIRYYAKRWTAWQLLRRYIYNYTKLYYTAAKRGAKMVPPLLSKRPMLREGEYDDIDLAVLEHVAEFGY
ncbi:hypothetical protein HK104_005214 [Borealophlyctis nickersoniae]|nr:hypothetical protein HK104_005214 [Borealophlyctis nickersoniae]